MFISLRRKYIQVVIALTGFCLIAVSLFHTSSVLLDETNTLIKDKISSLNHFDVISTKLFRVSSSAASSSSSNLDDDEINTTDSESHFNQQVDQILDNKLATDVENKYWLVNTDLQDEDTTLTIPDYYSDTNPAGSNSKHTHSGSNRPALQPFDPRFTIGMYVHWIEHQKRAQPDKLVTAPFHWYDWVDLSALDRYLLAAPSEKPDCMILDARDDEKKLNEEKDRKNREKQQEEDRANQEKQRQEEEQRKQEEEKNRQEEEQRKQEEDKNRQEEEQRKQEEAKIQEEVKPQEEVKSQEEGQSQEENKSQEEATPQEEVKPQEEAKPQEGAKPQEEVKPQEEAKSQEVKPQEEEKPQESSQEENKQKQGDDNKQESQDDDNKKQQDDNKNQESSNVDQKSEDKKEDQEKAGDQKQDEKEQEKSKRSLLAKRGDSVDPKEFCTPDIDLPFNHEDGNMLRTGFNVHKPIGRTTPDKALLAGKSYLYSYAPSPMMIIFLTHDGSYNISTNNKRAKLLDSNLVDTFIADTGSHSINSLQQFRHLQQRVPSNKENVISQYEVSIPESDFTFNHSSIIKDFETQVRSGKRLSKQHMKYFQSLKYSVHSVANGGPPKYFSESRLLDTAIGDHYDWRFFNGIKYGTYEQTLTLHRLVRTFVSFCRKNGITTWVAHGSLLSWYWNGIAFPWDNDIDVQVPVMDLHKLSLNFNQSLIVEDMEDGFGRYFLDCGSFITLREKGNGNNNIDARFIDVDTGLYIDITGLAISNTPAPDRYPYPEGVEKVDNSHVQNNLALKVYNCRNNHFSSLNELSPLVQTYIEGEVGYVPKKYTDILSVEYTKGLLSKKFSGYVFVPQLRLWIKEEDLYYFLNDRAKWEKYHSYNEEYMKSSGTDGEISDVPSFEDASYELTNEQKDSLRKEAEVREKQGKDTHGYKLELNDDDLLTVLKFSYDELVQLLNKDELLMNYITTREMTALHEEEIMRLLFGKSTEKLINEAPDFKPMKFDPFLYYVKNDYVSYDAEVENYMSLLDAYKLTEAKHEDELLKASGKVITPDGEESEESPKEEIKQGAIGGIKITEEVSP